MSKTLIIVVLALSTAVILYLCYLSIKLMRAAHHQVQSEKKHARLEQMDHHKTEQSKAQHHKKR